MFDTILAAPPSIHHAYFGATLSGVLKAPITEVATFYGPDDRFQAFDFEEYSTILPNKDGFFGWARGAVVEDMGLGDEKVKAVNILAGWASLKAHEEFYQLFQRPEVLDGFVGAFKGLKGREVHHVKLMSG
jgi:hypothetical protein